MGGKGGEMYVGACACACWLDCVCSCDVAAVDVVVSGVAACGLLGTELLVAGAG